MDLSRPYHRLFAPVVTPLDAAGEQVDTDQMRTLLTRLAQPRHVDAGLGLIMNSEAGEIYALTQAERRRNVEIGVDVAAGRFPVFAGVTGASTTEARETARQSLDAGATGLFILPPIGSLDITGTWDPERYPEVLVDFVAAILTEAGDVPVIMHPTGPRSPVYGIGLPLPVVRRMWETFGNIVGWKMTYSYEGFRRVARALRESGRDIAVLCSSAVRFHENLATGQFDGTVTGSLNYSLEAIVDHLHAWQANDVQAARKIWDGGLAELQEYVYSDYSRLHIRYKIAAWLRGHIDSPLMRAPMPRPQEQEVRELHRLLTGAGAETRPLDSLDAANWR